MNAVGLGSVADVIRGVSFSKQDGDSVPSKGRLPIIRAGSIQETLLLEEGQIWVPKDKIKEHQKIRRGDIVMCTSSGSPDLVGKCAKSDVDFEGSFGAFCAGIRPDPSKISASYLYHFLSSPKFRNWTRSSSGANIKNIRVSELADFAVPLPPLSEQKCIATILDKADAIRRKRQQAIQLADEFLRAVFLDMFGDLVLNPKNWDSYKLGDLIVNGPSNGLYKPSSEYGEGVRILRIDGFYEGSLRTQSMFKRVKLSKQEIEKYSLFNDSIVINRVNSREYLGKCALIEDLEETTVFESNMMNFMVDKTKVLPRFIVDQLCTYYVKGQILTLCKDAVNQSSINQQDVKSIEIRVPPIKLQNKYLDMVFKSRKLAETAEKHLMEAQLMFSSTSLKMFSARRPSMR